ncbi:MAG: histidine phosphatase family protein [Acholeplasmataceae bacterium]
MILKVMRHSLTNLNESQRIQGQIDIPLSANGEQLAHQIWKAIDVGPIDYIVSSPLLRATQTAMIASKYLNYKKPIVTLQLFIERNFGILDYQPIETSRPLLKHPKNIEGFEHNDAFESRITEGLNILHKYYSFFVTRASSRHFFKSAQI